MPRPPIRAASTPSATERGHAAVHPALGTLDASAGWSSCRGRGMETALDIAVQ